MIWTYGVLEHHELEPDPGVAQGDGFSAESGGAGRVDLWIGLLNSQTLS